MMKYSGGVFEKIFYLKELEFVVKFLLNNHRERLFKFTGHMQKTNFDIYSKVADMWIKEFDKRLKKPSKTLNSEPIIII